MPEPGTSVDVSSTLAALARTLDSAALRADLGQTTVPAPKHELVGDLGDLELSGDARYEALGTLGLGGMGKVDAVWDRDLMRELALKQVHAELANDGLSLRQFLWEARVTAHLDHPNVVPVHDLGLDQNGQLYFTMKRVRGRSLAQLCALMRDVPPTRLAEIQGRRRATPAENEDPLVAEFGPRKRRVQLYIEVCQAIAYAHDRGVLHRDLKPANVMIGEFGEVLVMDWGLALPLPSARAGPLHELLPEALRDTTQTLIGTPRYMAPELLGGQPPSVRTDIYALGVMLYELLALRLPHNADSVPALVLEITEGVITPLSEAAPQLPRSIVAVVAQAMAVDPAARYASVGELIEDLEAVLDGFAPRAEGASMLTRAHRYYLSKDNPDVSHFRFLDLDLTGASAFFLGTSVTLVVLRGFGWLPLAAFAASLALIIVPMRAYWGAVRRGHRRLERERARQSGQTTDA